MVGELDKASESWGVKVLRYEIKNIEPPQDILAAMEKQMRAEREKRALILTSEGQRDAAINTAEGEKQQVIKASEANRQQQINEAEGQASAIRAVATATAQGIREVADAIRAEGGRDAVQLRVAEQYVAQFGNLARTANAVMVPATVSDVAGMIATAMRVFDASEPDPKPPPSEVSYWPIRLRHHRQLQPLAVLHRRAIQRRRLVLPVARRVQRHPIVLRSSARSRSWLNPRCRFR